MHAEFAEFYPSGTEFIQNHEIYAKIEKNSPTECLKIKSPDMEIFE